PRGRRIRRERNGCHGDTGNDRADQRSRQARVPPLSFPYRVEHRTSRSFYGATSHVSSIGSPPSAGHRLSPHRKGKRRSLRDKSPRARAPSGEPPRHRPTPKDSSEGHPPVVARFGEDRLEHVHDAAHAHTLGVNEGPPEAAPAIAKERAHGKRRHVAFGLSGRIQRAAAVRACPASLRPGG